MPQMKDGIHSWPLPHQAMRWWESWNLVVVIIAWCNWCYYFKIFKTNYFSICKMGKQNGTKSCVFIFVKRDIIITEAESGIWRLSELMFCQIIYLNKRKQVVKNEWMVNFIVLHHQSCYIGVRIEGNEVICICSHLSAKPDHYESKEQVGINDYCHSSNILSC